jgi:hypothetical protein
MCVPYVIQVLELNSSSIGIESLSLSLWQIIFLFFGGFQNCSMWCCRFHDLIAIQLPIWHWPSGGDWGPLFHWAHFDHTFWPHSSSSSPLHLFHLVVLTIILQLSISHALTMHWRNGDLCDLWVNLWVTRNWHLSFSWWEYIYIFVFNSLESTLHMKCFWSSEL